jgi:hypothetical protein
VPAAVGQGQDVAASNASHQVGFYPHVAAGVKFEGYPILDEESLNGPSALADDVARVVSITA